MNVSKVVQELIDKHRREGMFISDVGFRPFVDDAAQHKIDVKDEKEFSADFIKRAKCCGWIGYHTFDSRRCRAGFPDWVLLRGPRELIVELKVGDNMPTAEQEEWLAAFRDAGREVHVFRPEDWPKIEEVLK